MSPTIATTAAVTVTSAVTALDQTQPQQTVANLTCGQRVITWHNNATNFFADKLHSATLRSMVVTPNDNGEITTAEKVKIAASSALLYVGMALVCAVCDLAKYLWSQISGNTVVAQTSTVATTAADTNAAASTVVTTTAAATTEADTTVAATTEAVTTEAVTTEADTNVAATTIDAEPEFNLGPDLQQRLAEEAAIEQAMLLPASR